MCVCGVVGSFIRSLKKACALAQFNVLNKKRMKASNLFSFMQSRNWWVPKWVRYFKTSMCVSITYLHCNYLLLLILHICCCHRYNFGFSHFDYKCNYYLCLKEKKFMDQDGILEFCWCNYMKEFVISQVENIQWKVRTYSWSNTLDCNLKFSLCPLRHGTKFSLSPFLHDIGAIVSIKITSHQQENKQPQHSYFLKCLTKAHIC